FDAGGERLASGGDQGQVLGVGIAFRPRFLLFDGDVAPILHLVAEGGYTRMQVGDAYGGRTHIDATAVLPVIERRADDGDVGAWHLSIVAVGSAGSGRRPFDAEAPRTQSQ